MANDNADQPSINSEWNLLTELVKGVNKRMSIAELVKIAEENKGYFNFQCAEIILEGCVLVQENCDQDKESYQKAYDITNPFSDNFGLRACIRHGVLEQLLTT